jgi:hypothetical protein
MGRRNKNRAARRRAELLRARKHSQLAELQGGTPQQALTRYAPPPDSLPLDSFPLDSLPLDSFPPTKRTSPASPPALARIASAIFRLTSRTRSSILNSQFSILNSQFKLRGGGLLIGS